MSKFGINNTPQQTRTEAVCERAVVGVRLENRFWTGEARAVTPHSWALGLRYQRARNPVGLMA